MSERNSSAGRYDVTAELGRGSMGIVCLAHDPVMGRELAIKTILLPHGLPDDEKYEFQQRFLREAQAAGRLSHPGIVTVYDYSQDHDGELPFIAMEYVPGFTLHELIVRDAPLDPNWAVAMADNLADALQTAHDAGVVHRDLKPANILVRESDGAAKITDFGIARINSTDLTQAGTTYGSPAYMAPERIKGQHADARSDLYSLAVILYEALCGERPFAGEDFTSLCYAIVNEPLVPIRTRQPELSIAFEAFFRRALAKDPDERFQDGAGFRKGLESVLLQQRRFETGAATLKMMMPPSIEGADASTGVPVEQSEATEDDPIPEVPWRWIAIGASAIMLLLLSFVAGWALRRDATDVSGSQALEPGQAGSATAGSVGAASAGEADATDLDAAPESAANTGALAATETASAAAETPDPKPAKALTPPQPEAAPVEEPVASEMDPVASEAVADASVAAASEGDLVAEVEIGAPLPDEEFATSEQPIEPEAPTGPVAVGLNVKNNIKDGTLTLLVDGEEVYAADLSTQSGKKLKGAYKKVLGKGQQLLEAEVELPAGSHTITALAYSAGKDRQYETTLDVELEPGDLRTLQIVAGRTLGKQLTMRLD